MKLSVHQINKLKNKTKLMNKARVQRAFTKK